MKKKQISAIQTQTLLILNKHGEFNLDNKHNNFTNPEYWTTIALSTAIALVSKGLAQGVYKTIGGKKKLLLIAPLFSNDILAA